MGDLWSRSGLQHGIGMELKNLIMHVYLLVGCHIYNLLVPFGLKCGCSFRGVICYGGSVGNTCPPSYEQKSFTNGIVVLLQTE